ncbi:putative small GTPase superfamily, ARF/SAR type, P-loop containing nucleoside triphosphate hydrolase [Rosa chinensis]|uniref:Putative small GTPase superfamily, ARF/SAR type, P-loop containing nucleoside triphosphate hydrolase n=1 Tax=Rosa chinensis TaxID=74649 RepID=A0A2P6PB81_ROSCH|nr:putative small GTPase superfamily, ARF/SAR type, P-loop containing nucleoside triphosphate hydrolase [Rosa chinensis]
MNRILVVFGEVVTTNPTVGRNVEKLVDKNTRFEVWDLSGQDRLTDSWETYCRGTHAIIVAIDNIESAIIFIMKDELHGLLGHEDLQHSVVLFLLINKISRMP